MKIAKVKEHIGALARRAADKHDTPVGFLSAEAVAERELHIHEMSVSEAYQAHGIGRALSMQQSNGRRPIVWRL
jgi:ribosomal protein S18 acetylase RimI-like enzyme